MAYTKTIPAGPVGLAIATLTAESSLYEARKLAQRNMASEMRMRRQAAENALLERVCKVMGGPLSEKDRPDWEDAMFEAKAKFLGQTKDFGDIRPDIAELLEKEAVQLNG